MSFSCYQMMVCTSIATPIQCLASQKSMTTEDMDIKAKNTIINYLKK